MSTPNSNPVKEAIDRGVHEAFAAEDYLTEDGAKDMTKVRERMYAVLAPRKVLALGERKDKAVTRGNMVREVFPGLLPPEQHENAADPQLAAAVWNKIQQAIWGELRPGASGPMQRIVGLNSGNGYILCRYVKGTDKTPAAYITDVFQCIQKDYVDRDNADLLRKIAALRANREMLIMRQPKNARRYASGLDAQLKAISAATHDQLKLAIEASTANGNGATADADTDAAADADPDTTGDEAAEGDES